MEKVLQVVSSEIEIIKQDFEKRNSELRKKIEQLEEEKMHLRLDVDVQKLEIEKLRKEKNKDEEDLDSLKIDYKKLRLSMRTVGLGKNLEKWRQDIREEKNPQKDPNWLKSFQLIWKSTETYQPNIVTVPEQRQKYGQRLERLEQLQREMQYQLQTQMQEELTKIQQDMMDKMLESQRNMMTQLTQLLAGGIDKGKVPMANIGEDNEESLYPPGFTPPNA
ncbi:hypothetical protein Godav_024768 [Gossypium davidsonii]|uniref:Uncharacterized protein n=1 Tax=Gossypium davidsonii TaxID=34287 RepID=A0A7J8TJ02_GOSDV|nr:hypothetical protein [Gossypium davidsonii]